MAVSGVVTLLVLVVLSSVVYFMAQQLLENNGRDAVRAAANSAIELLQRNPHPGYRPRAFGEDSSTLTLVLPPSGTMTVLAGPQGDQPTGLPDQASLAIARTGRTDLRDITLAYENLPVRVLSEPALPDGTVVQVIQDRSPEVKFMSSLLWTLAIAGFVALLLSVLAGYLYAGRALVPIRRSVEAQRAALLRQREFAANASHELRTPLTVISASVEDLERNRRRRVEEVGDAIADIRAETRHMTALVEDMLLLARSDSGVAQVERIPVDLGDIAAEAASMLVTLGRETSVNVVLDPRPAPLSGDPLRLRQLVTILVDNAIRHSTAGGTVSVLVRSEGGMVVLQVDDEGPGIRAEDLPHLFERFWRADNTSAIGTGLGLAIAKWIVGEHGGTIEAANRPEGGASFRVRLALDTPKSNKSRSAVAFEGSGDR
jgi:signal transduction histidine kinase